MVHMVAPSPAVVQTMGQSRQVENLSDVEKVLMEFSWHEVEFSVDENVPGVH